MTIETVTFEQLVEGLQPSVPCQMHEVLGKGVPCGRRAGRVIFWRNPCAGGKTVEPPFATTLCRAHSQELVRAFDQGILACDACDQRITSATHSVKRIEDL